MQDLLAPRARDPRIRVWKIGGLFAAFFFTIYIGNFFIASDKAVTRQIVGFDFMPFYWAGHCVRTGQLDKLYDLDATRTFEIGLGKTYGLELGSGVGPWWNPPYAAWLFEPLAGLSYPAALTVWWIFGGLCLAASFYLLSRMLQGGWKTFGLIPLFLLSCTPFVQAFTHGQNTFFSLLLLTITVALWRTQKPLAAGLVCGLLLYKPQLGLLVGFALCIAEGRRALLGFAITAAILALVNVLTLPGTIHEFLVRMPPNMQWMQEKNLYHWERHDTLKAFWRYTLQGSRTLGPMALAPRILWYLTEAALGALYARVAWAAWKKQCSTDRFIAATVLAMPLLMPFYFDYDGLLMAVAVVAWAADRQRDAAPGSVWPTSAIHWEDTVLPKAWLVLFCMCEFNTGLASNTRIDMLIPMMTFTTLLLFRRALRPPMAVANAIPAPAPMSLAA